MVSWMRVLGRWNFRVALDASWQSIYRLGSLCKAPKTWFERITLATPSYVAIAGLLPPSLTRPRLLPAFLAFADTWTGGDAALSNV